MYKRQPLFDRVLAVDAVLARIAQRPDPTAFWRGARDQAVALQARDVRVEGLHGPAIARALAAARTQRLADWQQGLRPG